MGICRDCFGKLAYTATNTDKAVFSVHRGENKIIRLMPYYRTDARLSDPVLLWMDLPEFESFIQAVKYLKENLEQLQ